MILGAIAGDIAGSTFEYRGIITGTEETFFNDESTFTDDSILTIAVAEALINKTNVADTMRHYAELYPCPLGGYGVMFVDWLDAGDDAEPYNSYGNGSAMRVCACGWLADSLEGCLELAKESAECTHNHPEGIKGAQAVTACIFLARQGKTKEEIKKYVKQNFYPDMKGYDEYNDEVYDFHATCQETVPRAISAFLYSSGFEDAIRFAMLIDKDTDTIGAIVGSIAEAYYGVPDHIRDIVFNKLDDTLRKAVEGIELRKLTRS